MIRLTNEWGTIPWLLAQSRKVTDSDVSTLVGTPGTAAWRSMVERLFLDHELVPQDPGTLERLLAFRTAFRSDYLAALAWYEKLTRAHSGNVEKLPGLVGREDCTWLAVSPHGLNAEAVVHVRPHRLRVVWESEKRNGPPAAVAARCQVLMYVTRRPCADVINYWDSHSSPELDAVNRVRIEFEPNWISTTFLPAAAWAWQDVRAMIADAYGTGT